MEKNSNISFKSAMNAGAIVGISLILFSLLLYVLGLTMSKSASYIGYLVLAAGIYFTGKYYRDKELGGFITYGKALGYGVIVTFFASIILAFFTYILFKFVDTSLVDKMLQMSEEELINKGMPEEQIEMAMNMTRKFMKPEIMPFMIVLGYVFTGFLISLITSLLVKKEGNPFQTMQDVDNNNQ
jgi:hypothetical protein